MKNIELNTDYAYDLSELNDNELQCLKSILDNNSNNQEYSFQWLKLYKKRYLLTFEKNRNIWAFGNNHNKQVINAKKLFENNTEVSDFKTITDSIASLLEYKNKKYGNSALEPLNIFKSKCKVGDRLDDKLARVKNNDSLQKNDIADLIGYLFLVCKENNWNNFDEFKD